MTKVDKRTLFASGLFIFFSQPMRVESLDGGTSRWSVTSKNNTSENTPAALTVLVGDTLLGKDSSNTAAENDLYSNGTPGMSADAGEDMSEMNHGTTPQRPSTFGFELT